MYTFARAAARRQRRAAWIGALFALAGCAEVNQLGQSISTSVKASLTGDDITLGRIEISSPVYGYATCFKDTPGVVLSSQPIGNPSQGQAFSAAIMTRDGVVAPGSCAELQKLGLMPAAGAAGGSAVAAGRPADYRTIAATELAGIFERNPQPGGGKVAQWPRVAITLVEAPGWRWEGTSVRTNLGAGPERPYPGQACWKFKARVWPSPTQSSDVAPFYFCTGDPLTVPAKMGMDAYVVWTGLVGGSRSIRGSTGIERTQGPNFPDTPLPMTLAYQRANFGNSFTGRVVSGIFYATGMNFEAFEDRRLWLVVDNALAPR